MNPRLPPGLPAARLPLGMALGLVWILLAQPGCKRHRNDPDVGDLPWEFHYDARLVDYTAVDEFEWETFHDWAFVEFEGFDFSGEILIEIFDDHDELIFSRSYFGDGGDLFAVDETLDGDEGDWFIVISSFDVDGIIDIDIY